MRWGIARREGHNGEVAVFSILNSQYPFLQMNRFWLLSTITLITLTALIGCSQPPTNIPLPTSDVPTITPIPTIVPRPAPDLTLTMLGGEETTLEQWQGQGVILNFWATWCFPCRAEMPLLAEIDERYEDVVVVGVNYLENQESAAGFVNEFDIPFPIVVDDKGWLSGELEIKGLPTTIYINADEQIVGSKIGPVTEAELEAIIPSLVDSS